jgi:hypothetical protein
MPILLACSTGRLTGLLLALIIFAPASARADWITYRCDTARSGVDSSGVGSLPFAPAWTSPNLGGAIYAEPLVHDELPMKGRSGAPSTGLLSTHRGTSEPGSGNSCLAYGYQESVLKLDTSMNLLDHWAPSNWQSLDSISPASGEPTPQRADVRNRQAGARVPALGTDLCGTGGSPQYGVQRQLGGGSLSPLAVAPG